ALPLTSMLPLKSRVVAFISISVTVVPLRRKERGTLPVPILSSLARRLNCVAPPVTRISQSHIFSSVAPPTAFHRRTWKVFPCRTLGVLVKVLPVSLRGTLDD